jgi:hypothetical protein
MGDEGAGGITSMAAHKARPMLIYSARGGRIG